MTHREEMEILAQSQGLYLVPEYDFEHCIYPINKDSLSADPGNQMYEIYKRCCDYLRFQTKPDVGVTVVISPRWMFVSVLTQPYAKASLGNPVYLDGLAFAGLVSLQNIDKVWPATADLVDDSISI